MRRERWGLAKRGGRATRAGYFGGTDHVVEGAGGGDEGAVVHAVVVADVMDPDELFVGGVFAENEGVFIDDVKHPFRGSGILRELEDVGIFPDQVLKDIPLAIDLSRSAVNIIERPHIIEPACVVFMVVCQ